MTHKLKQECRAGPMALQRMVEPPVVSKPLLWVVARAQINASRLQIAQERQGAPNAADKFRWSTMMSSHC